MVKRYTRQEFYDLVWSNSMIKLAAEFGLSDVALHKTCRRHQIPTPPLGYWAKVAHGKPTKQTPLSAMKDEQPIVIHADRLNPSQSAAAQQAKEKAKEKAIEPSAVQPQNKIVAATIAALRKAKPHERGLVSTSKVGTIECRVAPVSVDRLELILDRLVVAASLQGFSLKREGETAFFVGEIEPLRFDISEEVKRTKHVQTEAEAAARERYQKQLARRRYDWSTSLSYPSQPEWDYTPTGKLGIEFETVYVAMGLTPRRAFRDGRSQSLENMATEIAIGMAVLAQAKADERKRCEEQARLAEIEREKRVERERLQYIEDRRAKAFGGVLERWDKLKRTRELVSVLTQAAQPRPERYTEMLRWAEEELEFRELQMSADTLERVLAKENVFGEDDARGFYPNRW